MKYYIITGTSNGLGESIAYNLINKEHHIFCISRNINDKLINYAKEIGASLDYFKFDISRSSEIESLFDEILSKIDFNIIEYIALINNAAIISPVKSFDKIDIDEIINVINTNLTSIYILSNLFISKLLNVNTVKKIMNISSNAAAAPYFGLSTYSSLKSAVNTFTRCVGLEQEQAKYPVQINAFIPGNMDTNMQKSLRESDKGNFPSKDKFINLHRENKLKSTHAVAQSIMNVLIDNAIPQGEIIDIATYTFPNKNKFHNL
jgi:benzil reductase ((S)-benzoin forming)